MSRGRSRLGAALAASLAVAAAGLGVWSLVQSRSEAARESEPARAAEARPQRSTVAGEPVITLAASAQKSDGIETVALHNAPRRERLRAYGTVLDLRPLTELANRYANAKAQRAIAEAKLTAARTAYRRAEKLYKDRQNISAAQLQEAEAAFRVAEASLAAAQSGLRTLALSAQQSWGPALGQAVVDAAPLLDRLIGRREVLIQVTLRPGQSVALPPTGAVAQAPGAADRPAVPLRFISAATRTDPRIQGLSFFFTAPAESGLLAGMNIVALIPAGPAVDGALVPASAIVWEHGRAWAYFRVRPGVFARRAIATDRPAPKGGYIVQGVPEHAVVVVAGAQMLLSEEFRSRIDVGDED